ncbi:MAG: peptide ABC transporter permease, partial [Deltaproteobacteria bacterium]
MFWRYFWENKLAVAGGVVVVTLLLVSLLAPYIAPYDPSYIDVKNVLVPPCKEHLLGTDQLGRDVLSRIIYGGRIPIIVSVLSAIIALSSGTVVGWISGFSGGFLD